MSVRQTAATGALAALIFLSALATHVYVQGGTKLPVRGVTMSRTDRLALQVVAQASLTQKGSDLVLAIRLNPGKTAKLWADNVCQAPKNNALQFTTSGTYTIPVKSVRGSGEKFACLLSSDNVLKASLATK